VKKEHVSSCSSKRKLSPPSLLQKSCKRNPKEEIKVCRELFDSNVNYGIFLPATICLGHFTSLLLFPYFTQLRRDWLSMSRVHNTTQAVSVSSWERTIQS